MKKILFSLFAILALCMTSCKDEVKLVDPGVQTNPEKELAGTYTGEWSVQVGSDGDVVTAPGSITISDGGAQYRVNLAIKCDYAADENINMDIETIGNITPVGTFYNSVKAPNLEAPFYGAVKPEGTTLKFQRTLRSGRKTVTYYFSFEGK